MSNEYREASKWDLQRFSANFKTVIEAIKQAVDVLHSIKEFSPLCASMLELSLPFQSYADAGYPLGKSIRGFKKWHKRDRRKSNEFS